MLPSNICGRITRSSMMSTFSEMYYDQTPCSTAFVREPRRRTAAPLRDRAPCEAAASCTDDLAGPSGALCSRHCRYRLPQPRYRRAYTHPLSPWWYRCAPPAQSTRHGSHGDPRVERRTLAGHRPRPAYGRRRQCQLDHRVAGYLSGRSDPDCRDRRDCPLGAPCRWVCLQAPHLDAQTQSRDTAGLRGKRLRVEVILAGAGTSTPPPVTALVEPDLIEEVPPDVDELRRLLPHADVYLQDEVQFSFHPTLTRVWCRQGRRGQRLVEAPAPMTSSMALGSSTGVTAGSRAAWPLGVPPMSSARKCAPRSPARARAYDWRSSLWIPCVPILQQARAWCVKCWPISRTICDSYSRPPMIQTPIGSSGSGAGRDVR